MEQTTGLKSKFSAICMVLFCYALYYTALGQLVPFLRDTYGLSMLEAGSISTVQSVGSVISVFVCILFFDLFNKPKILGLVVASFCLLTAFLGTGVPFPLIVAAFFLIGIAMSMMDTLSNAVISDHAGEERSFHMNLIHAFFGLGGVIGPLATAALIGRLGGNGVFIAIGIICLFIALYYLIAFRKEMKSRMLVRNLKISQNFQNILVLYKQDGLRDVFAIAFLLGFFDVNITFWYPTYYKLRTGGLEAGSVAIIAFYLLMTAGRLVSLKAARKYRPFTLVFWGSTLTLVFVLLSLFIADVPVSIAALALGGFFYGNLFPQTFTQSCHLAPDNPAAASGLVLLGTMLGLVIGPLIVGAIGDRFGLYPGLLLNALVMLPAIFFGLRFKKNLA